MSDRGNTRNYPIKFFQYPIIPDWLYIWCQYPYPIRTRSDPKYFFQYPIHTRPEVEKPYPSAPGGHDMIHRSMLIMNDQQSFMAMINVDHVWSTAFHSMINRFHAWSTVFHAMINDHHVWTVMINDHLWSMFIGSSMINDHEWSLIMLIIHGQWCS